MGISTKFFESFVDLFFEVGQIDFPSSPKSIKTHGHGQIFCAVGEFLKKQAKKVFRHFLDS